MGNTNERLQSELKMFGDYVSSLDEIKSEHIDQAETLMYAMGILSDAQHVMEGGNTETARQFINKAKYYISEIFSELREAEINKIKRAS